MARPTGNLPNIDFPPSTIPGGGWWCRLKAVRDEILEDTLLLISWVKVKVLLLSGDPSPDSSQRKIPTPALVFPRLSPLFSFLLFFDA